MARLVGAGTSGKDCGTGGWWIGGYGRFGGHVVKYASNSHSHVLELHSGNPYLLQ